MHPLTVSRSASSRRLAAALGLLLVSSSPLLLFFSASRADEPRERNETIRGRVVYLAEAMERLHGVTWVPEAAERILAVETPDGELIPLVEDVRGRAFRRDKRLRELDVELLVRRYRGSPAVQLIRLYAHEEGERVELDYWCDVCAIAMFELKPCDCCQGPIELRRRPAPRQAEND